MAFENPWQLRHSALKPFVVQPRHAHLDQDGHPKSEPFWRHPSVVTANDASVFESPESLGRSRW
jgi:hypothetical protein